MQIPDDFYRRIEARVRSRIVRELRSARRIVDIGCGDCELARLLEQSGTDRDVIGIDVSDAAFPKAHSLGKRLRCIKADARRLAFPRSAEVDAVVLLHSLHELAAPMACLRQARRLLGPGGEILVVDFPKGSLAQRLWNEDYYTTGEVAAMLKRAGFAGIRATRTERRQLTWARAFKPRKGRSSR